MIDSLAIIDIRGVKFDFTIGNSPPKQWCPVQHWNTEIEERMTLNDKMQAHGKWPGPQYMGQCTITVQGALLSDTFSQFNTRYRSLSSAVHPRPTIVARDNTKVGTLRLKPTGGSLIETDVALESFTCPRDGNTYAEWQIVWISFDPWFIERASGNEIFF